MMSFVCRRTALSILGAAVFFCAVSRNASAATVVVTPPLTVPCKSLASYPTISLAIASVPANSTIFVCPGTYPEQLLITKSLTITGVAGNRRHRSGSEQSCDYRARWRCVGECRRLV